MKIKFNITYKSRKIIENRRYMSVHDYTESDIAQLFSWNGQVTF